MKNKSKIRFTSLIIPLITFLLFGCHGSKNDFSVIYKFTGMSVENAENFGDLPNPTSLDSVPAVSYAIRVNLFSEIIAEGSAHADYDHPPENHNWIKSINITSNSDFGIDFPAGTSLNEKFIYFNGSYFHTYTLDQLYVTNSFNDDYSENPVPDKMDLLLISPPPLSSTHIFIVEMFLFDGTVIIDSTSQIKLY